MNIEGSRVEKALQDITAAISNEIEGTVEFYVEGNAPIATIRWEGEEIFRERKFRVFQEIRVSFAELENMEDPLVIAKRFIREYREWEKEKRHG